MAYKASVPQSTDIISQSQIDFRQNFESINQAYGFGQPNLQNVGDHVSLTNDNEEIRGGHRKLTLPEQGSAPSTAATEIAAYAKETSSKSEIYYRQPSDGSEIQLTKNGGISVGGLVLRAYVLFDFDANIIKVDRQNAEGDIVKTPVSYNIASVVANQPLVSNLNVRADWNITFTNALPTANYFWVLQSFNTGQINQRVTRSPINIQPRNNVNYSSTVSSNFFYIRGMPMQASTLGANFNVQRVLFQAYTVN